MEDNCLRSTKKATTKSGDRSLPDMEKTNKTTNLFLERNPETQLKRNTKIVRCQVLFITTLYFIQRATANVPKSISTSWKNHSQSSVCKIMQAIYSMKNSLIVNILVCNESEKKVFVLHWMYLFRDIFVLP